MIEALCFEKYFQKQKNNNNKLATAVFFTQNNKIASLSLRVERFKKPRTDMNLRCSHKRPNCTLLIVVLSEWSIW